MDVPSGAVGVPASGRAGHPQGEERETISGVRDQCTLHPQWVPALLLYERDRALGGL